MLLARSRAVAGQEEARLVRIDQIKARRRRRIGASAFEISEAGCREDTGAGARCDGLVAEEGRLPGPPRARRRLLPRRPHAQDRQWRQHPEASRGRADVWVQGRAGDVRDPDVVGAGRAFQEAQAAGHGMEAAVGVAQPVVVVDRGRAIETVLTPTWNLEEDRLITQDDKKTNLVST